MCLLCTSILVNVWWDPGKQPLKRRRRLRSYFEVSLNLSVPLIANGMWLCAWMIQIDDDTADPTVDGLYG